VDLEPTQSVVTLPLAVALIFLAYNYDAVSSYDLGVKLQHDWISVQNYVVIVYPLFFIRFSKNVPILSKSYPGYTKKLFWFPRNVFRFHQEVIPILAHTGIFFLLIFF